MYKILSTLFVLALASGQRVAPGVPPQHYQQPPQQYQQPPSGPQHYQQHTQQHLPPGASPQQYQQQQMQYQQVPIQQQQPVQQVPVHQQQQVPIQQVPQGHGGSNHAPHSQQQVLNTANIQHEREHIQEHMQVPIDTSKMSEAELQFHYFKMHDSDNNNKLDGCELIKSLIHWHVGENKGSSATSGTSYTDDDLANIIDHVLETMDLNNDGYVDYTEYRKSEEVSAKAMNK